MKLLVSLAIIVFVGLGFSFNTEDKQMAKDQPVELGDVSWIRNLEEGIQKSAATSKPIFLLFQEVPGCGTCQRYGQQVLKHPLIVDAIEEAFVPVVIYNNKGGDDRKALEYFGEPSWNNPVVRIVDEQKKNLVSRVAGDYTVGGVALAMVIALKQKQLEVPRYLELLNEELNPESDVETAYLSMYCFWTGEKELAEIEGIVETQAGFMDGREVVKVKYDVGRVEFKDLVENAQQRECAGRVYTESKVQEQAAKKVLSESKVNEAAAFRLDAQPKYFLSKSKYRYIPMTQLQAVKVNSALGKRQSPDAFLSSRQLLLLENIDNGQKWKSAINEPLMKAWNVLPIKKA